MVEQSAVNRSVVGSSPIVSAMACWRSGLTHMPFTHTFMGSNPVQVTNSQNSSILSDFFIFKVLKIVSIVSKFICIKTFRKNIFKNIYKNF